jgi:phosphoglycolate phosphatase-like HAD superfamily hydrolase
MNTFRPTRGFLFDFDGTLVDTMEGYADIAGRLIHEYFPSIDFHRARSLYIQTSGIPFVQQIELIRPNDPLNKKIVKDFEDQKIEGFFASHVPDDARSALRALREKGFLAGVSSGNYPDLLDQYIEREKVEFDIVMGYDHTAGFEKGKPHFDFFSEKFGLTYDDITFVGDSLKDADKGYLNGVQFIGVLGLFKHEDFEKRYPGIITVSHVKEIPDLLRTAAQ